MQLATGVLPHKPHYAQSAPELIKAGSNLAAEREKQTRKQLEDALAPKHALARLSVRPEQSS
jgi:hypothetical protein